MTTEAKPIPKWRRALSLALKIYASLCTFLVTAYLALVLWSIFFAKLSPAVNEANVMASYGAYVANESPKRADHFWRLAAALGMYSKEASVPSADVFKYLGTPDLIAGTAETGSLAYLYEHPKATNRWAVFAFLKDGKLVQIGFNDATMINPAAYHAYPSR
jgi:hypothetical protein